MEEKNLVRRLAREFVWGEVFDVTSRDQLIARSLLLDRYIREAKGIMDQSPDRAPTSAVGVGIAG